MLGVVFLEGRKIGKAQTTGGTGEDSLSGSVAARNQGTRLGTHKRGGKGCNAEGFADFLIQGCCRRA